MDYNQQALLCLWSNFFNLQTTTLVLKLSDSLISTVFAKFNYNINLPQTKQTNKLLVLSTVLFELIFFVCIITYLET